MKYASIGSISHATLRNEDLIPNFANELAKLIERGTGQYVEHEALLDSIEARIEVGDSYWNSECAGYDMEELHNALQEFAPPYCVFGSHPGDGANFGFWPITDIQELEDDGVLMVDDLSKVPADHEGLVVNTNCHGNMTLYKVQPQKFEELWSIV